ncbi:unnamed protein product [Effrenium voratum]|nr:unnamed protein product [Effrenium voratum]
MFCWGNMIPGHKVVAEIVVSELREGLTPLKTAQPPLSSAVQRVQAVKARKLPQHLHQANSILESLRGWGTMPGTTVPAWVEHLKADSPLGRRWTKVASMDLFAREPGLLYRVLLFCGEVRAPGMILYPAWKCCDAGASQPELLLLAGVAHCDLQAAASTLELGAALGRHCVTAKGPRQSSAGDAARMSVAFWGFL